MDHKLQHVDAVFGGKTVRFAMPKDVISRAAIDRELGSPMAALLRFGNGTWRYEDVPAVLSFAYPGATAMAYVRPIQPVETVVNQRPVAVYAALASKILRASLFGLAPGEATFHEDNPFDAKADA